MIGPKGLGSVMGMFDRLLATASRVGRVRRTARPDRCQAAPAEALTEQQAVDVGGPTYQRGLTALERGDLATAERCFRQAAERRPDIGWFAYRLGGVLAALGRYDEADAIFAQRHRMRLGPELVTDSSILLVGARHHAALVARRPAAATDAIASAISQTGADALLFLCCDAGYFTRYAAAAIASALANGAIEFGCHVHLINPDRAALDEEARIRSRHPGSAISFSRETVDLAARSETERKVYYSCRRFQLMPALLRQVAGPVIIADIDQLVIRSLEPVLARVADGDVGLIRFDGLSRYNPLAMISASALVAGDTTAARAYFDLVCAYVDHCLAADLWVWHLDQAALYGAYTMLNAGSPDGAPPVRFSRLDPAILESTMFDASKPADPAPATVFWSVTASFPGNAAKHGLDVFCRYSRR
jgi:hypothetical protein